MHEFKVLKVAARSSAAGIGQIITHFHKKCSGMN